MGSVSRLEEFPKIGSMTAPHVGDVELRLAELERRVALLEGLGKRRGKPRLCRRPPTPEEQRARQAEWGKYHALALKVGLLTQFPITQVGFAQRFRLNQHELCRWTALKGRGRPVPVGGDEDKSHWRVLLGAVADLEQLIAKSRGD